MESPKVQASCSVACAYEESDVVQVSDSSKTLAPVTTAAVTEDVAEHLQPQQSFAGHSVVHRAQTAAGIKSQWNLLQVFTELGTEEDCIVFCEEEGLIPVTKTCSYHKRPMKLSTAASHGQLGLYRCNKSNCRTKPVPRAQGTWFENMHLALPTAFQIMYFFSHGASYEVVQRETALKEGSVLSTRTIADWYSYCRETIVIYELENQIYDTKIGGPNKLVIIDEAKFQKKKYKRGKNIEGYWVLGMVANGSDDIRLEVCPKNKKSEILVSLIQKHVAEGSIIRTGWWKEYDCLSEYGYIHERLRSNGQGNQSEETDETHTERTENNWRRLKCQFQKYQCKRDFLEWLAESSWRRKNKIYKRDPFQELLKAVKHVYKID